MELEYKNLNIDIKAIDDKGTFNGLASPYNNVDDGNDKVFPSIGKRNNNKNVPLLWQHDTHKPIGSLLLTDSKEGIQAAGALILDKNPEGQYLIPQAAESYALLKKGLLKLSIGYKTLDYSYEKVGNQSVRDLKDIDIMEVSLVTFPMNEKATITSVKEKGVDNMEEKAMSFADLLKVQQANDMRWKLQDALNDAFRQLMNDENMKVEDKITQLSQNVDDFAAAYKENMTLLLQASAKSKVTKKEIENIIEKKETEQFETKAGKKISKANKTKLQQCKDTLTELLDSLEDEADGGIDEGEEDKNTAKGSKAKTTYSCPSCGTSCTPDANGTCTCPECGCKFTINTKPAPAKPTNKQKNSNDDTIELKSDELEMLQGISKFFKGDEE